MVPSMFTHYETGAFALSGLASVAQFDGLGGRLIQLVIGVDLQPGLFY